MSNTDVIKTVINGILKARREYSLSYPQVERSFPSQHPNSRLTTHDFGTVVERVDLSVVHDMYRGTCLSLYSNSSSVYLASPLILLAIMIFFLP